MGKPINRRSVLKWLGLAGLTGIVALWESKHFISLLQINREFTAPFFRHPPPRMKLPHPGSNMIPPSPVLASDLQLRINPQAGNFDLLYKRERWLGQGMVGLNVQGRAYHSQAAPGVASTELVVIDQSHGSGRDALGHFTLQTLTWQFRSQQAADQSGPPVRFLTSFRIYRENPYIVFEQVFPDGLNTLGDNPFYTPSTAFPQFVCEDRSGKPLAKDNLHVFAHYYGTFAPPVFGEGLATSAPQAGVPLVLFDDAGHTLIMSPLNNFMTGLLAVEDGDTDFGSLLSCGIQGQVQALPPGFKHQTILVAGSGITATYEAWGQALLTYYNKPRTSAYADDGLKYLGYWTDNGAYYYYHVEPGTNYEQILLALRDYHKREGIPFRYYQIDSWWYVKDPDGGGLIEWRPQHYVFPNGIKNLQARLGMPLIAHNRYLSRHNNYSDAFPQWIGGRTAHPTSQALFDQFMRQAANWGVVTYEQDWMSNMFFAISELRRDTVQARQWLVNMSRASQRYHMTVQYSMSTAAMFLQTVELPNVTTTRVSSDYALRENSRNGRQWRAFGYTSTLAWALGLWPFKDTFISGRDTPGKFAEPANEVEALLSILSGAMVGPGDKIGYSDKALLLRTCREDGLLLKPDKPATPLDRCFFFDPAESTQALVLHTYSQHGTYRWHYSVPLNVHTEAVNVQASWTLADLRARGPHLLYNYRDGSTRIISDHDRVTDLIGLLDYRYYVAAPLLPGNITILGDTSKFVTASSMRLAISPTSTGVRVTVSGVSGTAASITGFALAKPRRISVGSTPLDEVASHNALHDQQSGWTYHVVSHLFTIHVFLPTAKPVVCSVEV